MSQLIIMNKFKDIIERIEQSRYLNWKTILVLYLITRIGIVILLGYGTWNGQSLLCYNADCKARWHNVELVVSGLNPYRVWRELGGYTTDIPEQTGWPPFFLILTSIFAFFWKSIWAMRLVFFLFDFLNLVLIYKLAKFRSIVSLFYILAPSLFRGLLFVEDEIFVTFLLASIYFFNKGRYSLSTLMLALSFNHKFFPIILFPVLLLGMNIVKKTEHSIIPKIVNYRRLIEQISIFILVTVFWHLFYFPDWYMFYDFRIFHYTIVPGVGFGIWALFSRKYYTIFFGSVLIMFYVYSYLKNLDIKTSYFLGSLLFFSTYPAFSVDHIIFLIPLFLIWTKLNFSEIFFWIFLTIGVSLEFLGLPTIGIISPFYRDFISILILIGFYLVIANGLRKKDKDDRL